MKEFKLLFLMLLTLIITSCTSEKKENTSGSDSLVADSIHMDTTSASISKTPSVKSDSLLIPGKSAGLIKIDQDAAELFKIYGTADAGDAAMQKAVAIWYKDHNPKSYATAIYTVRDTGDNPPARIKQIRVTSPGYKTVQGLGISSSLKDLSETYALVKIKPGKEIGNEIYDSKTGITFEIDKNKMCSAVIIHEGGQALSSTYLPFW
ncbi:hypothetical protein ACXZ1K_14015 [Pedobacter sp. PWIIR3]